MGVDDDNESSFEAGTSRQTDNTSNDIAHVPQRKRRGKAAKKGLDLVPETAEEKAELDRLIKLVRNGSSRKDQYLRCWIRYILSD